MIRFILFLLLGTGSILSVCGQQLLPPEAGPTSWLVPDTLDRWELQFVAQRPFLTGEVRPEAEWGGGVRVARSMGHAFALRLGWNFGRLSGLDWQEGIDPTKATSSLEYRNYRTQFQQVSVEGVFRINNLHFRHAQPRWTYYALLGLGAMRYQTQWDQLDGNNQAYAYEGIQEAMVFEDRKDKIAALNNLRDGVYETAQDPDPLRSQLRGQNLAPSFSAGLGIRRRLGPTASLALEYRVSWQNRDDLDGYRHSRMGEPTGKFDLVHSPSLSLNIMLGRQKEGYPWHNPIYEAEQHFRSLAHQVDTLEKQLLVMNEQLAQKPDTVQIIKEVESLDQSQLMAKVDSLLARQQTVAELEATLFFDYNQSQMKEGDYLRLFPVVAYLRAHPDSKITLTGHADIAGSETFNQQLSLQRAENVALTLEHLFAIERDRMIVQAKGESEPLVPTAENQESDDWKIAQILNRRVLIRSVHP